MKIALIYWNEYLPQILVWKNKIQCLDNIISFFL